MWSPGEANLWPSFIGATHTSLDLLDSAYFLHAGVKAIGWTSFPHPISIHFVNSELCLQVYFREWQEGIWDHLKVRCWSSEYRASLKPLSCYFPTEDRVAHISSPQWLLHTSSCRQIISTVKTATFWLASPCRCRQSLMMSNGNSTTFHL